MPKYDKIKKLYLPLNVYKTERTVSLATDGRKVFGGIGNEGLDVGIWIQERIDDGTIVVGSPDLTALIALTGMPGGSSTLGTFTGSTISDNTTIKNALQELETSLESIIISGDGNGIYDGNGNVPANTESTLLGDFSLTSDGTATIQFGDSSNLDSGFGVKVTQYTTSIGQTFAGSTTGGLISTSLGGTSISFGTNQEIALAATGTLIIANPSLTIDGPLGSFVGAKYQEDYSPQFVDLSLVTKKYVDDSVGAVIVYTDEEARDAIGAALQNNTGISWTIDDIGDTITPVINLSDFSTDDLPEGSNLYFTDERVDDRVASLLVAGTNISLTYNDGANTLTIDATASAYTDEQAQDAIGSILLDSNTINFSYDDPTPNITAEVITQMSVTSDASGVKLLGDATSPGNNKYYGTDGSGTKGYYTIPTAATIPSGTSAQTLRYNSSNVLVANSTILNDGTYVGIGGSPISGYKLFVNGGVRSTGIFYSRGSGTLGSDVTNAEIRIENTTALTGNTWYLNSSDTGELLIATSSISPEITLDTSGDVIIGNKIAIGNTTNIPDTLIGIDSSGYIGEITLGSGLSLVGGELSAPSGTLPTATATGQIIYWDGVDWVVAKQYSNVQNPTAGTDTINLPHTPISDLQTNVYLNGVLKEDGVDYNRTGNTIIFTFVFATNDKVTTQYYN